MNLDLRGKIAVITGGTTGIGLRIAHAFANEGANVAICGRGATALASAASELQQAGVRAVGYEADVTDPSQAAAFIHAVADWAGHIDVLVNNVGGSSGGNLLSATDDEWQFTFNKNLFQAIRMIRNAVPYMPSGSAIVNITSISGWVEQLSGTLQYGAAKAALIYLTEPLALQLAPSRIRVNAVSPGSISWPGGGWDKFSGQHPEVFTEYLRNGFPGQRLGRPEEVADTVVFLASQRAHWINGRHIAVDGLQQPLAPSDRQLWRPGVTDL